MKCAIYARVSSEEQARQDSSVPLQLDECRNWAKALGWEVVAEYKDEGLSGSTTFRPAFQRMRQDAEKGLFEKIIVHAVDRWGRSTHDVAVKDELEQFGVTIAYKMEGMKGETEAEKMALGMFEIMAKQFLKTLSTRVKGGIREVAKQGRLGSWGHAPYGYTKVYNSDDPKNPKRSRTLVIDETVAPFVREIFRRADAGESIHAIARYLNENKIVTMAEKAGRKPNAEHGYHWFREQVRALLVNPIYVGDLALGQRKTIRLKKTGRLKTQRFDPSQWMVVENNHPAIIERDVWQRVNERLRGNKARRPQSDHPGNLLAYGIGRCMKCNGTVTIRRKGLGKQGLKSLTAEQRKAMMEDKGFYFGCYMWHRHKNRKREECSGNIPYEKVIGQIEADLALYVAQKPEEVERLVTEFNAQIKHQAQTPELEAARRNLQAAQKKQSNLIAAIAAGGANVTALVTAVKDAEAEAEEFARLVHRLDGESKSLHQPIDAKSFIVSAKDLLARIRKHGGMARLNGRTDRELLEAVFSRIIIDFRPAYKTTKARRDALRKTINAKAEGKGRPVSQEKKIKAAEELAELEAEHASHAMDPRGTVNAIPRFEAHKLPPTVLNIIQGNRRGGQVFEPGVEVA